LQQRRIGEADDLDRSGPRSRLPINHLLCENRRTLSRIGEVGLASPPRPAL
jgi:hypothetical protein